MAKEDKLDMREVPQNLEAEQALLGALLTNNRALESVGDFLRSEHFAYVPHGKIYSAILNLIEKGHIADPVTLKGYFTSDNSLEEIGGAEYLMKLASGSVTIINVADYGHQIFDRYIRRQLIDLGYNIVNDAFEIKLDNDAMAQIGSAERDLFELASKGQVGTGLIEFKTPLEEAIKAIARAKKSPDGISGISTGLHDVDKKMGGLHPSDLIVLAARPGMGKTALATCIAYNAAYDFEQEIKEGKKDGTEKPEKKGVAFFSLEMSSEQLASRVLSTQSKIDSEAMRNGTISDTDLERLAAAVSELGTLPLYVDDTPGLSVSAIRARARRMKRDKTKGLGLIIIDYIQLIDTNDTKNRDNRVLALSEVTRSLKIMAKELNVPVIALSQLSRKVEEREDKRPMLSDLRESGSIEQDADVVIFIFRERYYLENSKLVIRPKESQDDFNKRCIAQEQNKQAKENIAELIIAKQRHGSTGTVELYFNGKYTEFGNLAKE